MSCSDFTQRLKHDQTCNKLITKDASCRTIKKQINVVRCIDSYDVYGVPYNKNWFSIPMDISATPVATFDLPPPQTTPLMYSIAPLVSTTSYYTKKKNKKQ